MYSKGPFLLHCVTTEYPSIMLVDCDVNIGNKLAKIRPLPWTNCLMTQPDYLLYILILSHYSCWTDCVMT